MKSIPWNLTVFASALALLSTLPLPIHAQSAPPKRGPVVFDWHADEVSPSMKEALKSAKTFEAAAVQSDPEKAARSFLQVLGARLTGAQEESNAGVDINRLLTFERSFADQVGDTTAVFRQEYRDVPVYGSDVRVHMSDSGSLKAITSKLLTQIELPTAASLSPRQAIDIAREHSAQPEKLRQLAEATPELFIYLHEDSRYHLIWLVEIPGNDGGSPALWKYFIDAQDGSILSRYNDVKFVDGSGMGLLGERKPLRMTRLGEQLYVLEDSSAGAKIRTFNFKLKDIMLDRDELPGDLWSHTSDQWSGAELTSAVDAHFFAREVFDYYWTVHGRNSLDNKGMPLVSSLNTLYFLDPAGTDGKKWNNAAWLKDQMVYGIPDGVRFSSMSGALDIIAHEFTHGVIESSADLDYHDQSGALNESYADVFAAMVDTRNWDLGEDVFTPGTPGDALRSLEEPTRYGQPDHNNKYVVTAGDNGGVHTNSGIPNKAAFLIAVGGTHNGITVQGIGREATEQIYYLTLTKYLSKLSSFEDARKQTIKATRDLFPGDDAKLTTVKKAFAAVGIGDANP